jgi:putative ubiquitin-RnfH superfamily antitoxin RatB of RatAB toxin-antitoxin module
MGAAETPSGGRPTVEVAYALPDRQRVVTLPLPVSGLTAGEAVERSGLLQEFPEITTHALVLGVYGAICEASRPLRDGDRVEIYRPLPHDPRATRRERVAQTRRKPRANPR